MGSEPVFVAGGGVQIFWNIFCLWPLGPSRIPTDLKSHGKSGIEKIWGSLGNFVGGQEKMALSDTQRMLYHCFSSEVWRVIFDYLDWFFISYFIILILKLLVHTYVKHIGDDDDDDDDDEPTKNYLKPQLSHLRWLEAFSNIVTERCRISFLKFECEPARAVLL